VLYETLKQEKYTKDFLKVTKFWKLQHFGGNHVDSLFCTLPKKIKISACGHAGFRPRHRPQPLEHKLFKLRINNILEQEIFPRLSKNASSNCGLKW
jgi:hypothetical protein